MKALSQTCTFALGLALTGCASGVIRVESEPGEAQVSVVRPGGVLQPLGKTPLDVESSVVSELYSRPVTLQIEKSGYLPESILVPPSTSSVRAAVTMKLRSAPIPAGCAEGEAALSEVSQGVAEILRMTNRRDYDSAERLGNALLSKYPKTSPLYDLMGNLFYLRRESGRALDYYRRSNQLAPNNRETLRMIEKLETIRGEGAQRSLSGGIGGGN